jgi:hypothetical protein
MHCLNRTGLPVNGFRDLAKLSPWTAINATHSAAPNSDPEGRDINRRVDVKVLVNKGLDEAI